MVKNLVELGKQRGFITYDEITRALPENIVAPEALHEILDQLEARGVRVIEAPQETESQPDLEDLFEPEEKGVIDDSVRYYISRIRDLPLLSREEEIRVAMKIDLLRRYLVSLLFQSPVAVKMLVERLEEIYENDVSMRRVFETSMTFDEDTETTRQQVMETVGRLRRYLEEIVHLNDELRVRPLIKNRQRVTELRRICVRELRDLTIQTKVMREVIQHLENTLHDLRELAKDAAQHPGNSKAEQLRELENLASESDVRLEDRISRANRVFRELEAAKRVLASANVRLVISISTQYRNRGLSLADLIQEGNLGLMKAIEKYRHRSGFKFATYAVWWIRQSISRALLEKARTIKIPVHRFGNLSKLNTAGQKLMQKFGRNPSVEEMAREAGLPTSEAEKMILMSRRPVSIDKPVGEDSKLLDLIEAESPDTAHEMSEEREMRQHIEDMLATLSYTEREVLRLRFGLDADRRYTLEEVGKIFGLTRERIRQIEQKALRRLKESFQKRIAGLQTSREAILEHLAEQLKRQRNRHMVAD